MGEAKRRREQLGEDYGKEERIVSWLPLTKKQSEQFVDLTSRGAWLGIVLLAGAWVTIRFIGPALGLWHVN